jgi:hypothetical protein
MRKGDYVGDGIVGDDFTGVEVSLVESYVSNVKIVFRVYAGGIARTINIFNLRLGSRRLRENRWRARRSGRLKKLSLDN